MMTAGSNALGTNGTISDKRLLNRSENCLSHSSIISGAERLTRFFPFFWSVIPGWAITPRLVTSCSKMAAAWLGVMLTSHGGIKEGTKGQKHKTVGPIPFVTLSWK